MRDKQQTVGGLTLRAKVNDAGGVMRTAERLGVHAPQLCRWISGKNEPSLRTAIMLRDTLGVPVDAWLEAVSDDT